MTEPSKDAKAIFLAAIEMTSSAEREAYLGRACGDDESLRRRVKALIVAHENESFLAGSVVGVEATIDQPSSVEQTEREGLGQTADQSSPLSEFAISSPTSSLHDTPSPRVGRGTRIGPYKLLQQLGEGGMGTVFMAEQSEPVRRKVALKIIKAGTDSAQVIARFEAERQALALMDHQNIARVLDAGTTSTGRPYFVMELVKGIPITQYCDQRQLAPRQRMELMVPVCQAIQHAHRKGVIHRDIKPSNILVTPHDGHPVPKVIDFGIAKATGQTLTDKTLFTEVGQIVGTLEYMSPEQAELNQLDVDTRADVYALGVVLYELLTGTTPITRQQLREAGLAEMLRTIREQDPPKPSTRLSESGKALPSISAVRATEPARLSRIVRGELDWIVMKALEKERARRYESASGLADDLQRFLRGDAVIACPPSVRYRLRKFARRNKAALTTAAIVAVALLLGMVISIDQAVRARKAEALAGRREESERNARIEAIAARDREAEQRLLAQHRAYAANSLLIQMTWDQRNFSQFAELLDAQRPRPGEVDLRGFEWHHWNRTSQRGYESLAGHQHPIAGLSMTADGSQMAVAACGLRGPGEVWLWDIDSKSRKRIGGHQSRIRDVAISPDGRWIAAGIGRSLYPGSIVLWDLENGSERMLREFTAAVDDVEFSPDGRYLAAISQYFGRPEDRPPNQLGELMIWENISQDQPRVVLSESIADKSFFSVDFDASSERVAVTSADPDGVQVEIRNLDSDDIQTLRSSNSETYFAVAFSPSVNRLAASTSTLSGPAVVELWDLDTGSQLPVLLTGHTDRVASVSYSPDGSRIATGSFDRTVRIWDAQTGEELHALHGHFGNVGTVAFTPDGQRVASGGDDLNIRLWNAEEGQQTLTRRIGERGIESVAFSADGSTFIAGGGDGIVTVWDTATGQTVATLEEASDTNIFSVAISHDQHFVAAGTGYYDKPGELFIWDLRTREIVRRHEIDAKPATSVTFSPDSEYLLSVSGHFIDPEPTGEVKLWHVKSGREINIPTRHKSGFLGQAAFSPDGRLIAWSWAAQPSDPPGSTSLVKVFDLRHQQEVYSFPTPGTAAMSVAFSRDGGQLAAGMEDKSIRLWNLSNGESAGNLNGHTGRVHSIDFNHDATRLVSSGQDGTVKLWDLATFHELLTLDEQSGLIWSVDFSPDGKHILSGSTDGTIKLWDGNEWN